MAEVRRITPAEAHERVMAGQALLICAYEEPEKYLLMRLEGSISLQEFRALRANLSKDRELIFYCA